MSKWMPSPLFVVQASSRSWSGGPDLCMNPIDGWPAVYWTVERILTSVPKATVAIAAPAYDAGGAFENLFSSLDFHKISLYYGYDQSPLDRFLDITKSRSDDDYLIRVDGLHCFFDVDKAMEMWDFAQQEDLDCVKFPDDFPVQFTVDVYRVGALRAFKKMTLSRPSADMDFFVHPKFYMFHLKDRFRTKYLNDLPTYSDTYLRQCRQKVHAVYLAHEESLPISAPRAGDGLSFRYEVAARFLETPMEVLDVACGSGFGTAYLSKFVRKIFGADCDAGTVQENKEKYGENEHLRFSVVNAEKMEFPAEFFDAVVSIETIEHLDASRFIGEVHRILKKEGKLVLSTPQNRLGHIPINFQHVREFSLQEIAELCRPYFHLDYVAGQKAGRIMFDDDPIGTTTLLVGHKS